MTRSSPLLLCLAAALGACTPVEDAGTVGAASSSTRQCFFASQVDGFSEAPDGPNGENRVHISTGPRDVWLFETWGSCPELDFSLAIGFDSRFSGSVCPGDSVNLRVPRLGGGGTDRCPVRMIRKLTPEEVSAR